MRNSIVEELRTYGCDFLYLRESLKSNQNFGEILGRVCAEKGGLQAEYTENNLAGAKVMAFLQKKQRLEHAVADLEQPYKSVLYLRYFAGCSVAEIAKKLNYSQKRIYQLHSAGIKMLTDGCECPS